MCTITGGRGKAADNPMNGARPLLTNAPLCQARNRAGKACRCPAVKGGKRCRLHGGAKGSGAPQGERNGMWKHGGYEQEAASLRREVQRVMKVLSQPESS